MKLLGATTTVIFLLTVQTSFALTTMGDRSCGEWINRHSDPIAEVADQSWLTGVMTGLMIGGAIDILAGTDGPSIFLWMDDYCRAHPLDSVGTGAGTLGLELLKRIPQH